MDQLRKTSSVFVGLSEGAKWVVLLHRRGEGLGEVRNTLRTLQIRFHKGTFREITLSYTSI